MSFFGSVGKALRGVVGAVAPVVGNAVLPGVGGVIGGAVGSAVTAGAQARAMQAAMPLTPSAFPTAGPIQLPAVSARTPLPDPLFGPVAGDPLAAYRTSPPGPGYHLDKKTRTKWVKNRRMNPMNPHAARRAIRRIKGARKMLQQIERSLPKQRSTRRAPAGHRSHLHHT